MARLSGVLVNATPHLDFKFLPRADNPSHMQQRQNTYNQNKSAPSKFKRFAVMQGLKPTSSRGLIHRTAYLATVLI